MTNLEEFCDCVSIQVQPHNYKDALYIGLEHLSSGRFFRISGGLGSEAHSAKFAFEKNDILYGKLRPYLDKAILAEESGICSTELLVLRPKAGTNPKFLIGVMHSPDFIEYAICGVTGAQHPRTSWQHIKKFKLPRFSLTQQQTLASFLGLLDNTITANEKTLELGNKLKCSAMQELFTRGLRNEPQKETQIGLVSESWQVKPLSDYIEKPEYGFTGTSETHQVGPKFLRITDIQDGSVNWNQVPYCLCNVDAFAKKLLKKNDIVVTRIGATTGKTFLIDDSYGAIFASYLIRIRAIESKLVSAFLYYFMQTSSYWRHIDQHKGGKLKSGVSIPILSSLLIPLPSMDEQREIARILDLIDQKINLHRRKKVLLEVLFKALLHKLITGAITAKDLDLIST